MAASEGRALGLHKVAPVGDTFDNTTIDIIAIHGLSTESPRTWEYRKKDEAGVVNWLADTNMLPAAIPEARVFTYDWDAYYLENAPVQTLRGHADNLLASVAENQGSTARPIIFVASCFGGLILAESINQAAQVGHPHRQILSSTVGAVFLATPFRGSDVSNQAQWQVLVGGIMGKQVSKQLIEALNKRDRELRKLTQLFAEVTRRETVQIPVHCFYETKRTELLRSFLSPRWASASSTFMRTKTKKLLVTENAACLDTVDRQGLDATHSGTNKFAGPDDANFKYVKEVLKKLANDAFNLMSRRQKPRQSSKVIIPFGRNEGFVGRRTTLQKLLEVIPPNVKKDYCQKTAIEGLGGVGKTQIALEAAYELRRKHSDCSIFWVPATSLISFEKAYRRIGSMIGVQGMDSDRADVKTLVKEALSQPDVSSWLLIIDNADDRELLFGMTRLVDYLPYSENGSILFTTRNHDVVVDLNVLEDNIIYINKMNKTEAKQLLRNGVKKIQLEDDRSTYELLDFLSYLPLAIRQASAYLSKTEITASKYLSHCQSSDKEFVKLLAKDFEDQTRYEETRNPITTTWLISFEHILRDKPLAVRYLKFICCLAEKDIPISLLPPSEDEIDKEEAIGTLRGYAFMTQRETSGAFDIHRLVQLAMRNWVQKTGEEQMCVTSAVQRLAEHFPWPEHENRETWTQILPHALTTLKLQERSTDELALSDLLYNVARSYSVLGKYSEAECSYQQALWIRQTALGPNHSKTLRCINNLAITLSDQGIYNEAEYMHQQVLKRRQIELGYEHHETISSLNNLALVLSSQGRYEEAERMHRRTLKLTQRQLGEEHPDTLRSMSNLAGVLNNRRRYEDAESMNRHTIELRQIVLGEEHPATLETMDSLARTLGHQDKYEEAEQMHRHVLELRRTKLGKEHPDTLDSMDDLAIVLEELGKHDEAERISRTSVKLCQKILGPKHPGTLSSMHTLARILYGQEKNIEAQQKYRQTLKLHQEILGYKHPNTLATMHNLALALKLGGEYSEAEQILQETVYIRQEILGHKHPDTLDSMDFLADVLDSQDKYSEAEEIRQRIQEIKDDEPMTLPASVRRWFDCDEEDPSLPLDG